MRKDLLKNKLYGILLIVAGLLSGDGTFAVANGEPPIGIP